MANNPVQIVLNAQDYVARPNRPPGGSIKDFFAGRNEDFAKHKQGLIDQVNSLQQSFDANPDDEMIYAKVVLNSLAWAKSHRPIDKIFPSGDCHYVGGAEIGSMLVELGRDDIPRVARVIASAEVQPKTVEKEGKIKEKPSSARSEVGAIQSIQLYEQADKRKFSIEQAVNWLSDPRTGSSYYVELFVSEKSLHARAPEKIRTRGYRALRNFETRLETLNLPVEVSKSPEKWTRSSFYIIKIKDDVVEDRSKAAAVHTQLIAFLEQQAIVKSILLPPVLQSSVSDGISGDIAELAPPDKTRSYPVVGIVDTGVADVPSLSAWKVGSLDNMSTSQTDLEHGTFIAGLVCGADELNPYPSLKEAKCQFFDLDLHPSKPGAYKAHYPRGFVDFLDQLDAEIPAAQELGVRVINMSLSVAVPVFDDKYSALANTLDEIADRHDVLFVLAAGNLAHGQQRDEWPENPEAASNMLLRYRHQGQDRIYQPADSIRSVVVGATNPPTPQGAIYPSSYTRKGPGPALGSKPDVAHVGGVGHIESRLWSVAPDGKLIQSCGTSFAAPLVAKTLAALDYAIEGEVSRETLIALLIHHAETPPSLMAPQLAAVKRDFVGAGIPRPSLETLLVADHEITLVFNGLMKQSHELEFPLTWPPSLVDEKGGCSGIVRLTTVYRPPIDKDFGGEFVRVNLDTYLRQEDFKKNQDKPSFTGRLKPENTSLFEKELLAHGAKWWPVKRLDDTLPAVGRSSLWKLVVTPLARSECELPPEGVPFSIILTIGDQKQSAPVFNEMRLQLQNDGVKVFDIRTALRPRVRQ